MIIEIEKTGTLSLKSFYLRRVFRLFPALLLYIALFTPVMIALGSTVTFVQIMSGIFYFANYYHLFIGYPPYTDNPQLSEHEQGGFSILGRLPLFTPPSPAAGDRCRSSGTAWQTPD